MGEQEKKAEWLLSRILIKWRNMKKGSREKTVAVTKLPLNLIQYCGISDFFPSCVLLHECVRQFMEMRVCMCAKIELKNSPLHSYALGDPFFLFFL